MPVCKYPTTSLSIGSANESFYTLMELLESEKLVDKTRRIKIFNGRWGGANQTKGLGLGTHWFIYKRNVILITITEQQSTDTYEKLTITLTKFGRSHKLFNDLLVELGKKSSDIKDGYTNVRRWISDSGWDGNVKIPNRKLDTIFIEEDDLKILLNTIRQFKESQQWYLDNGIPYQLGILLIYFENNPEACRANVLLRADNRDVENSITNLSRIYNPPKGTIKIWQRK